LKNTSNKIATENRDKKIFEALLLEDFLRKYMKKTYYKPNIFLVTLRNL